MPVKAPIAFLRQMDANLTRMPGLFTTAMKRNQGRIRSYTREQLRVVPGKPHYPIRWTSERQRRAFFASNGFGRGIPTRRTGRMVNAWDVRVTFTAEGGEIAATNSTDYWPFVVGEDQQGFHKDTGWYQVDQPLNRAAAFASNVVAETWITITDPFAGIP